MPFKQVFERRMNRDLQEEAEQRSAPPDPLNDNEEGAGGTSKRQKSEDDYEPEEEDLELASKKDTPPRFSAIFSSGPTAPPPPPPIADTYRRRSSGIFLPTPLFVFLATLFLLESTFLFAYTVLGLYNNLPSGLLVLGNSNPGRTIPPLSIDSCNCAATQEPLINFAPNFIMPGAAAAFATPEAGSLSRSLPTQRKTSTSPIITPLRASKLAALFNGHFTATESSPTTTTATTKPTITTTIETKAKIPVVSSLVRLTVDSAGKTLSPSTENETTTKTGRATGTGTATKKTTETKETQSATPSVAAGGDEGGGFI